MDEIKIKQIPGSEEHTFAFHKKNKDGKIETTKILRSNPDPELKRIAYSKLDALEKEVKIDHDKLKIS